MTYAEIDTILLTDEGITEYLTGLIRSEKDDFDYDPTSLELDSELSDYKDELRAIEDERLRVKDLKDRFENLDDMRHAYHTLYPSKPNPALWIKELLENGDYLVVEQSMKDIEAKDAELKILRDQEKTSSSDMKLRIENYDPDLTALDTETKQYLKDMRTYMGISPL